MNQDNRGQDNGDQDNNLLFSPGEPQQGNHLLCYICRHGKHKIFTCRVIKICNIYYNCLGRTAIVVLMAESKEWSTRLTKPLIAKIEEMHEEGSVLCLGHTEITALVPKYRRQKTRSTKRSKDQHSENNCHRFKSAWLIAIIYQYSI